MLFRFLILLVVGSEGGERRQTKRERRWTRYHVLSLRYHFYIIDQDDIPREKEKENMAQIKGLNAYDRPPEPIRQRYKKYQRTALPDLDLDSSILDIQALDPDHPPDGISLAQWKSSEELRLAFDQFVQGDPTAWQRRRPLVENIPVFTHRSVSGQHNATSSLAANEVNGDIIMKPMV